MRRFGRIHELTDGPISPAATEKLLADCFDAHAHEVFAQEGQVTFAYQTEFGGRYRVTVYHQLGGCAGVFHQVPSEPPSFDELGLPSAIAKLTTFPNGLLLVAGPVNGGKSSTLAALVNLINEERGDHVLTIEDTIETVHPSRVALLSQIEVGRHAPTQLQALRNALREDPDVITVDPLVDPEAIRAAVAAADSGQLVIGAVPTLTAVRTIDFIIDAFPPSQRAQVCGWLASSLRAVLAQRLLPTPDEKSCVLALEVLYADDMVCKHIRADNTAKINSVLQAGRSRGSRMLDDSLARLVRSGHITMDVARANAHNPNNFRN
jgi:twitching motility protein PilT